MKYTEKVNTQKSYQKSCLFVLKHDKRVNKKITNTHINTAEKLEIVVPLGSHVAHNSPVAVVVVTA